MLKHPEPRWFTGAVHAYTQVLKVLFFILPFTILLVCLQLKKTALDFAIVSAFSFGLALTMVTVGAVAAWSVQHAEKRFSGFSELMRKAPYVSCVLLTLLAACMAWNGWQGLTHPHVH